ncbi:DUF6986 family protein [Nocardia sp. CA-290969]|uniref:DUF6986 family protein n=1 Tax=Nocardia sp. CA-290969 TaxID=3239986 RepID=UPI003D8A2BEE
MAGSGTHPVSGCRSTGSLGDRALHRIDAVLEPVDAMLADRYPEHRTDSQPVHTVYVGAATATPETPRVWGEAALSILTAHRESLRQWSNGTTVAAVQRTLAHRPIMDLRIDFEDGYGWRPDSVEDRHARAAGHTLRTLGPARPDVCGIRVKGLAAAERRRAVRTLELVLDAAGGVPPGFVFTVPKLRAAEQVPAVVALCEEFERGHGLAPRALRFELQIESPQAIIGADGTVTVARALALADGRCAGLHYGTYDYSAACGIAAPHQSLEHPVADHAKAVMLVAAAQTGIPVCDGSTQIVPEGSPDRVRAALDHHFRLVGRSLERGFYQGWDMHPGHLVTRWAATFHFYRAALAVAGPRIQSYLDRRGGGVLDEPATAQALAACVLRGSACGAFTETELRRHAPGCSATVLNALADRTYDIEE